MGKVGKNGIGEMSTGPFEAAVVVWLHAQLHWEKDPGVASVVLMPPNSPVHPKVLYLGLCPESRS